MLMMDKLPFIVAFLCTLASAATNEFVIPENTGCVCAGMRLTYNCTVNGTGNTEWSGTLFDCPGNRIVLRHELFPSDVVTQGRCNNGDVIARELSFSENCYTSQLTLVANPSFNNKTVSCIHNSIEGEIIIGTSVLSVEGSYAPPENIILSRVYQRILTFNWTLSIPNCTDSSLSYRVTSDCGLCPRTTNTTSVTCSDVQLPPNESTCEFIVHTIVCESAGLSNSITVNFIAPDEPIIEVVPIYSSAEDGALIGIVTVVNQKDRFNSTAIDNMAGIVESYKTYIDATIVANNALCSGDECRYTTYVSSPVCDPAMASSVSVVITAANSIGESTRSNPAVIGCTNHFVTIEFDLITSTVTCQFLNDLDVSVKNCSVHYGLCTGSQQLIAVSPVSSTTRNITLQLDMMEIVSAYCFTATASNSTYTIIVKGRAEPMSSSDLLTIIIASVTAAVVLVVIAIIIIVFIIICSRKSKKDDNLEQTDSEPKNFLDSDLAKLQKQQSHDFDETVLVPYYVKDNCSVNEFCQMNGLILSRDSLSYEFSYPEECVERDMRVIFMKKNGHCFAVYAGSHVKLHGERVLKPTLEGHTVFVQCPGSRLHHLPCKSKVLYEYTHKWMWHVDKEKFKMEKMGDSTKRDPKNRIFYECKLANWKGESISDVILVQKNKERYLTGSQARCMVNGLATCRSTTKDFDLNLKQWRVFVMSDCEEDLHSKRETDILCQLEAPEFPCVPDVTIPLIRVQVGEFKYLELPRKIKFKEFQTEHDLCPNEPNVLVETAWPELNEYSKDPNKLLCQDVILAHSPKGKTETTEYEFYTCNINALLHHRKKIIKSNPAKGDWKLLLTCNYKENLELKSNLLVLYRVNVRPMQPDGLLPVHSQAGSKVEDFFEAHGLQDGNCEVFLKLDSVARCSGILPARDVLLADKSGALFSGPFARRWLNEQSSLAPDRSSELQWDVFVLSEKKIEDLKDKVINESETSLYYLKYNNESQTFVLLIVDEDDVRMSDFIKEKLNLDLFKNGNAYYEYDPQYATEDLSYYKEIILCNRARLGVCKSTKKQYHVKGDFEPFYKAVRGSQTDSGIQVTEPSITKVRFIQCFSQGSRCLKKGDRILYKNDNIKDVGEQDIFEEDSEL